MLNGRIIAAAFAMLALTAILIFAYVKTESTYVLFGAVVLMWVLGTFLRKWAGLNKVSTIKQIVFAALCVALLLVVFFFANIHN